MLLSISPFLAANFVEMDFFEHWYAAVSREKERGKIVPLKGDGQVITKHLC